MKPLKSICLAALLAAMAPFLGGAQPSPTNINPALLYYQAFLVAPDLSPADSDYLWYTEWQGQQLPERFGKIMASYDNEFRLLRQAARSTVPCDWGIDMSQGPATLLPHLARTKAAVLTARFRALWALQHGREDDARDDLLAAFMLARNVSRDGILISTLVRGAGERIFCSQVGELFGRFSPETLQQLLEAVQGAQARRTLGECVATEKALCHDWKVRRIQELQQANPGNDAQVMAGIRELFADMFEPQAGFHETEPAQAKEPRIPYDDQSAQPDWWARLTQAAGGTSEGVVKLIREVDSVEQKLAPILALPRGEYETQLAQLKAQIQYSPNPLLPLSFPIWQRVRNRELMSQMFLGMVHVAIEYKLHGLPGLQSATDPWGQGPFSFRRFVFEGVDRGFELKSACRLNGWPEVLIFVEKEGPPLRVDGRNAGQARPLTYPK